VQGWTADGRGLDASRAHAALPQRAQLGFADVTVAGQVWRSFSVAMPSRVIQVSQPLAIRRKLAADAAYAAVLPLLLVAPFMAAAAWWLTALALRPLQRVAEDVRRRDEQSLQPLPAAGLPDEVAPLVASLNALLQRLGESLDTQRAFVADAAHELRSPLTALKLQLQLFERAGGEAQRAAAAASLAAGIERAARLVEQLLTLARTEPGAAGAALQRLDLRFAAHLLRRYQTGHLQNGRHEIGRLHDGGQVPALGLAGQAHEQRHAPDLVVHADRFEIHRAVDDRQA